MRGTMRAMFGALAALWISAGPGHAQSVDAAENSAVRVVLIAQTPQGRYLIGTGSGFVAAPNVVVTNAHVVAPLRQFQNIEVAVVPPEGDGMRTARMTAYSPTMDLALVRFEGQSPDPLPISAVEPRQGDAIVALGYPDMDDLDRPAVELIRPTAPSRSNGAIASLRDRAPTGDPIPTINHEAVISSGSSGGPLLDECGRVIGVNTWHARGRETLEGRGVATRTAQLVTFLRENGVTPDIAEQRCLSPLEQARAERDAAIAAMHAQNQAMAQKLAEAERLSRMTFMAVAVGAGAIVAFIAIGVTIFLVAQGRARRAAPAGAPQQTAAAPLVQHGGPTLPKLSRSSWMVIGGAAMAALLLVALVAIFGPFGRGGDADEAPAEEVAPQVEASRAGVQACTLDRAQTRASSEIGDTRFSIDSDGCVNGRTQYVEDENGVLRRVLLNAGQEALDVVRYDARSGAFTRERYAVSKEAMKRALEAAARAPAPAACTPHADAASRAQTQAQVARRNEALMAFAGGEPRERVVWRCRRE